MTDPTSANLAHAEIIERLTNLNKSAQEEATAMRTALAQVEELIRQREAAIADLQGHKIS